MKYSKLTKALTLFFFMGMVISFLLYRTGKFDTLLSSNQNTIQQSPNGSVLKTAISDTLIKPRKSLIKRKPHMSSSKTLIATDDLYILNENDTAMRRKVLKNLQEEERFNTNKDSEKKTQYLFSGSKSGAVFTADSRLFDSLLTTVFKFDTTTIKKPKKKVKH